MSDMRFGVRVFHALQRYLIFFAVVAFLITCCMTLFVTLLSSTLGITLTGEDLNLAAKWTFANVLLLSLLFTVFDAVRRILTVERPVKQITDAAKKVMQGDFSVRIQPVGYVLRDDKFNEIVACFNTLTEELSSVETLRSDFIANVSHEMKTPLSVMQNYGILLQTPDLPEDKRLEYGKAVVDAARRLSDMMTNILKLNRLENQQIYPQATVYDLSEQICQCLLHYENVWESRGIEIETDIAEDVQVTADAELVSLVWNNLFSNAFKFTEEGGRVTLTLTKDGRYATVKIVDTGCGMSAEVGAHIFEKFYQGDTSHATQGNGLGLALVKRVVDIMQGEIGVESAVGFGTTFTVKIKREEYGE